MSTPEDVARSMGDNDDDDRSSERRRFGEFQNPYQDGTIEVTWNGRNFQDGYGKQIDPKTILSIISSARKSAEELSEYLNDQMGFGRL